MAFIGKLLPAGIMAQLEIVLPSFPVVVPVPKNMVPEEAKLEPVMVQLVMVLLLAALRKRMVEVPAVFDVEVLVNVNELPPEFKPLMVTLSAPFKFIN
jgi:hypothetical protein